MNGAMGRNQRRDRLCVLFILLIMISAAAMLPNTAGADTETMLANAESYYSVGEYDAALVVLGEVLAGADIPAQQRLDAYVLQARCLTQLDRATDARSAFLEALGINGKWRPDPVLVASEDEIALFNEALAQYEHSLPPPVPPVAVTEAQTARGCPSLTAPLVASGVLTVATIYFMATKAQAGDRWEEYAADPLHPDDLYAEYESALSGQKTAGAVSAACGVAAAYVWWKYIRQHKNCSEAGESIPAVSLMVAPDAVMVGWRF
jgi:tetratricopeptide (TPR) repeat protein